MATPRKQTDTCRYYIDNSFIRDGYGAALGPYAIAVYNAIAVHANQEQEAWPSHGTIAKLTGMSARQVMREIESLAEYNIVSVTSRAAERKPALIVLLDKSEWKPIQHTTDSHMLDGEHTTDSQQTTSHKTDSHMTYDSESYEHTTVSHTNRTNKTELNNNTLSSNEDKGAKPGPEIISKNPRDYPLKKIKAYKFTKTQYERMRRNEEAGKNRVTVLDWIDTKLNPRPEQVEIYYQVFGKWPDKDAWPVLERAGDCDRFREVLAAYKLRGWNKQDYLNIMAYYDKGIIPTPKWVKDNGANYGHNKPKGRTGADLDKEPVYDPYTGKTEYLPR